MLPPSTSHLPTLFLLFLLHSPPPRAAARPPPPPQALVPSSKTTAEHYSYTRRDFERVLNARRGSHVSRISNLKKNFHHIGYLPLQRRSNDNPTDIYDAMFESAVVRQQSKLGLRVTGQLDFNTVSQVASPGCGAPDETHQKLHVARNYAYFPGRPRWARSIPMLLTYAFSPQNPAKSLSLRDVRLTFQRAFSRWSSVIPVSFVEVEDYGSADIRIGFYRGDHGDGEPFDGVLGVLAHSFSPGSGRLHLDDDETWAVDFGVEKSKVAVDLESVAVHEIGHLLGLAHSSAKEAVMFPTLKPREKKVDLSVDDIQGVQALYGTNPNFTFGNLSESDISTNRAVGLGVGLSQWAPPLICVLTLYLRP